MMRAFCSPSKPTTGTGSREGGRGVGMEGEGEQKGKYMGLNGRTGKGEEYNIPALLIARRLHG